MMIIDKGYYDYDYKAVKEKEPIVLTKKLTDAELQKRLARLKSYSKGDKPKSASELQSIVMNEKKNKR